jgi:hypothetical protein
MEKEKYLSKLKNINLRPNKLKIRETKEEILIENKINKNTDMEFLNELFVGLADAEKMPPGPSRDAQLLRLGVIAEFDAANFYESMASMADDERVKRLFIDVAYEEKVHAGEFNSMLEGAIDPEYGPSDKEGEEEVDDLVNVEPDDMEESEE